MLCGFTDRIFRRFFANFGKPRIKGALVRIRFTTMKKFAVVLLALAAVFVFAGCAEENKLKPYVSELTDNVYYGESENYTVRGKTGYSETERSRDGAVGKIERALVLSVPDAGNPEALSATIVIDGTEHTENFTFNPVTFAYNARFALPFNEQTFEVILRENGEEERVTMTSVLPENTLDVNGALDALCAQQSALVESFMQNGVFCGEISMKVTVRSEKAYWYIGLTDAAGRTHAFLMDGASGEVLAAKDIFQ